MKILATLIASFALTASAIEFGDISPTYQLYSEADPFAIGVSTAAYTASTNLQTRVSALESDITGMVPTSRTVAVNGVVGSLGTNVSFTVSGGGNVASVNGKTGTVTVTASDVGCVSTNYPVVAWTNPPSSSVAAYPSLDELLSYQRVGSSKSQWHDTDSEDVFDYPVYGTIPPPKVVHLGEGTNGVIRRLFFTSDTAMLESGFWAPQSNTLSNDSIRIFADCGNVTNILTHTLTPTATIRMADLLGLNTSSTNINTRWQTSYMEVMVTNSAESSWTVAFELRMPVPFTNGILVQVGTYTNSTWVPRAPMYSTAVYELGLPKDKRLAKYRLKSSHFDGPINSGATLPVFLSEASGSGCAAFLFFSANNVGGETLPPIEGNWVFDTDNLHPSDPASGELQISGTEDILDTFKVYSWTLTRSGDFGSHAGTIRVMKYENGFPMSYDMYTSFVQRPVYWSNGVKGCKPWHDGEDAVFHASILYYQEVQ